MLQGVVRNVLRKKYDDKMFSIQSNRNNDQRKLNGLLIGTSLLYTIVVL